MASRGPKPASVPDRSIAAEPGFAPLPRGSRDRMPDACRLRRATSAQLLATFERWGYAQVMTPAVEYFDVLGRGLSAGDRERCVRFIEAGTGELVALRSDITPQIARMVSQRMGGELPDGLAVRLCYATHVVRQPDGRDQAEHHQAGVELIGDGDPAADAELIALCHEALCDLGLDDLRIDLAHTAVARDVLGAAGLGGADTAELHGYLARKDPDGVARLLAGAGVEPSASEAVAALCDLFGPPSVLDRARRVLRFDGAREAIDRLDAVLTVLQADAPRAHAQVSVDLGEVRGFDYYTGLRMRVWAPGVGEPLVRGGRYNDLLGRYGVDAPATGFAIELDALEAAMARAGSEPSGVHPRPAHIVAIDVADGPEWGRAVAAQAARRARDAGLRSWVYAGLSRAAAEGVAADAGAERLTHVARGDDGNPQPLELRRDEGGGWQPISEQEESNR